MTISSSISAVPFTLPVMRLTTSVVRGNVARFEPTREATDWGVPQIMWLPLVRRFK